MLYPTIEAHMPNPTLIFDLGGVLIRHDNELLYDRLAACCADPAAARPHMAGWLSDEDINRGRLSIAALHERLSAEHGFKETYSHFLELWSSHFSAEPGMEEAIRAIARLYRTVLLSNTKAAHVAHIKDNYRVFDHLHAAYLSHELGLAKPDAAAYLKVLQIERRRAEDCIFIDDRAENAEAAAELGLRTITFTGRAALLAALERYGVQVAL
jgi:putative hydrolase of the HAD superfamily